MEEKERPPFWSSLAGAVPGLLAPVIILGGLRSGLFTPTEAAVVAVFYGLFVGVLVYRSMGLWDIYRVLADSAKTSAIIMIIISLAGIFAWAGSTLGAFDMAAKVLFSLSDNGHVVLGIVMVLLLLAGMVLDGVSIYLIMLPLLMPLMKAFAWNPTWFGVLMAMNIAIGQFTPPVAVNLMVSYADRRRDDGILRALGAVVRRLDGRCDDPGHRHARDRAVAAERHGIPDLSLCVAQRLC